MGNLRYRNLNLFAAVPPPAPRPANPYGGERTEESETHHAMLSDRLEKVRANRCCGG